LQNVLKKSIQIKTSLQTDNNYKNEFQILFTALFIDTSHSHSNTFQNELYWLYVRILTTLGGKKNISSIQK
jgi:hypothetical protein